MEQRLHFQEWEMVSGAWIFFVGRMTSKKAKRTFSFYTENQLSRLTFRRINKAALFLRRRGSTCGQVRIATRLPTTCNDFLVANVMWPWRTILKHVILVVCFIQYDEPIYVPMFILSHFCRLSYSLWSPERVYQRENPLAAKSIWLQFINFCQSCSPQQVCSIIAVSLFYRSRKVPEAANERDDIGSQTLVTRW